MRVVFDTNVVVSAVLRPDGPAGRLLARFTLDEEKLVPVVDQRILDEYREVLARPKFGFDPRLVDDVMEAIEAVAVFVDEVPTITQTTTPEDDRPFLEVAAIGEASFLVTGNAKHFADASQLGVDVVSPGVLARLLEDDDTEQR